MNPKISADHPKRRAIVYIRQSSPGQVIHNQESQRRQYGLADHARQLGFQRVEIIDEDLGRSGSGQVERPGFQHLVAEVCTGEVGAVLCIEAPRLARNGREWHHLIELCGLVRSLVFDPNGVYDPGILNDRLLLGPKGTMSEHVLTDSWTSFGIVGGLGLVLVTGRKPFDPLDDLRWLVAGTAALPTLDDLRTLVA